MVVSIVVGADHEVPEDAAEAGAAPSATEPRESRANTASGARAHRDPTVLLLAANTIFFYNSIDFQITRPSPYIIYEHIF